MPEANHISSSSEKISSSILFFFAGIVAISAAFYHGHQTYYLGEDLKLEELVVRDRLVITKAIRGIKRYSFKAKDHRCTFWISHGALKVVQEDPPVKSAIEHIGPGDTIQVRYRMEDKERLDDPEEKVRIIELRIHNKIVIPKEMVLEKDRRSFNIDLGVGIGCLLLAIFLRIRKHFNSKKIGQIN